MERMTEQLLPAVSATLSCAFQATPSQLGGITFCRAVVQAFSSPLGGYAGHCLNRIHVIVAGAVIWGVFTFLFANSQTVQQAMATWAFNGVGLALIIPNAQSLIADFYSANQRGRAFGTLQLTSALGAVGGSLLATFYANREVLHQDGWRFTFRAVAAASIIIGIFTLIFAVDPDNSAQHGDARPDSTYSQLPGGDICATEAAGGGDDEDEVETVTYDTSAVFTDRSHPMRAMLQPSATGGVCLVISFKGEQRPHYTGAATDCEAGGLVAGGLSCRDRFTPADESDHSGGSSSSSSVAGGSSWKRSNGSISRGGGSMHDVGAVKRVDSIRLILPPLCSQDGGEAVGTRPLTCNNVIDVLTIPTFLIIILQGVVGSMPATALVYLTWYLELCGMDAFLAGSMTGIYLVGTALGGLLGGWIGDVMARHFPDHGRVATVQVSVASGIPLALLLLRGLPVDLTTQTKVLYAVVLFIFGLLTSWAAPACNNPVISEIVPAHMRTIIYSFDRSLEGAIAAMAAPLVGMAAERLFGYDTDAGDPCGQEHPPTPDDVADNLERAAALGNALLLCTVAAWTCCTCLYSGLYWTYPRDRDRARLKAMGLND